MKNKDGNRVFLGIVIQEHHNTAKINKFITPE